MDVEFTAGMETHLDEIEEGRIPWREVLGQFNAPFENDLAKARLAMTSLKREGLPTDVPCDRCGANMTMKYGRNGPFLSCSKYPECKNAADFKRDENGRLVPVRLDAEATGESCPQCGLPMARKKGKYGEFLACTGYPDCKTTRPLGVPNGSSDNGLPTMDAGPCPQCGSPLAVKRSRQGSLFIACTNYPKCKHTQPFPTGVACPRENCDGQLTERSSSRGVFWGCSNYPKCRFTLKHRPIPKACPDCQSPYLLEAPAQDGSGPTLLKCPNKACGYETPA
jgi:DNA topoisomerase-1